MKKLAVALVLLFMLVSIGYAGNVHRSNYVYKNACATKCHIVGGPGEVLDPESKTVEEWKELLKNKHEKLKALHVGHNIPVKLIEKKHDCLKGICWDCIEEYLTSHAYDNECLDCGCF